MDNLSTNQKSVNTPPASRDAEMMVLGSMLTNINVVNTACCLLTEDDFYFSQHRLLFRAMLTCFKRDIPIEPHLILEELKTQKTDEAAGGIGYIITCCQFAGVGADIDHYVAICKEKSASRRLINAATKLQYQAVDAKQPIMEILEEAQAALFEVSRPLGDSKGFTAKEFTEQKSYEGGTLLGEIERRQLYYATTGNVIKLPGVDTGFIDLDKLIENLGNTNLVILAARPAMGKTALAVNIAENVAIHQKKCVGFFTLEMSKDQLVLRLLASLSGVNSNFIQKGMLNGDELDRVRIAYEKIAQSPLLIDEQADVSIAQLRVRARRWKEAYGIELLIIDYLGLVKGTGSKISNDSQVQKIAEITRGLKITAKELNIPILCVAQLNRESEKRAISGHRPIMSDLKDSGSIEADADVVLLLHRPEYYDPHNKVGQAECIVAKNRHGGVGSVWMQFTKDLTKFGNLATLDQIRTGSGSAYKDN
jgi:replicative DNA helicase